MDPLNKLPHSFFAVNTVKTRFVYLAYDVAPNYVVLWFCKIRRAAGPHCDCETRNAFAWKQCPENLHGNLCCVKNFSIISLCRVEVSTKKPLSELAGFQISKRRPVLLARLARRSLSLAVQDYLLCADVQSSAYETRPANIDDVKQRIRFPKEMLQRAATS